MTNTSPRWSPTVAATSHPRALPEHSNRRLAGLLLTLAVLAARLERPPRVQASSTTDDGNRRDCRVDQRHPSRPGCSQAGALESPRPRGPCSRDLDGQEGLLQPFVARRVGHGTQAASPTTPPRSMACSDRRGALLATGSCHSRRGDCGLAREPAPSLGPPSCSLAGDGVSAVYVENAPGVFHGRNVTIIVVDFGVRR